MMTDALDSVAQWIERGLRNKGVVCETKGGQFGSQSGHMPGLGTRSPVGGT